MAKYTIELRSIVENGRNIFPFDYPFYDEKKRPDFEKKFIRNFYFNEIGVPTIDRFIFELESKFQTVFPYYNKLMEAATVQYDLLNNYNITETITTERETTGNSSGIASSVGKTEDVQTSTGKEDRTTDTTGNTSGSVQTDRTENGSTSSTKEGETSGTSSETGTASGTSGSSETVSEDKDSVKRFHNTPQGKISLNDNKYLTTLNHDTEDNSASKTTSNSTENSENKTGNTSGSSSETASGTSETTGNETQTATTDTTGKEVASGQNSNTFNGEQKTTADTNTRNYTNDKTTETHSLYRIGNIGVQTGADMMQKHIELQKVLQNIEKMFFAECEDLFMLVY